MHDVGCRLHACISCRFLQTSHITALFNSKTSIVIQKRHPYTENLNSETSVDSKYAFSHCGDVISNIQLEASQSDDCI